ncbi:hypothetical protein E2C01_092674 [Portunus trituberculatus]|uniref:Uncharacterized protein n=1 Tax=Portunus trituberculatus TaxID=210409 RepID=A0A5B7JMN3_PORTR|nr:hypothetical protein [Portunus trituberculatus]
MNQRHNQGSVCTPVHFGIREVSWWLQWLVQVGYRTNDCLSRWASLTGHPSAARRFVTRRYVQYCLVRWFAHDLPLTHQQINAEK